MLPQGWCCPAGALKKVPPEASVPPLVGYLPQGRGRNDFRSFCQRISRAVSRTKNVNAGVESKLLPRCDMLLCRQALQPCSWI